MTHPSPAKYLESVGYEVYETRGELFEVWLGGTHVTGIKTADELAAFADRVKIEQGEGEE
jgi:hypothetical protein